LSLPTLLIHFLSLLTDVKRTDSFLLLSTDWELARQLWWGNRWPWAFHYHFRLHKLSLELCSSDPRSVIPALAHSCFCIHSSVRRTSKPTSPSLNRWTVLFPCLFLAGGGGGRKQSAREADHSTASSAEFTAGIWFKPHFKWRGLTFFLLVSEFLVVAIDVNWDARIDFQPQTLYNMFLLLKNASILGRTNWYYWSEINATDSHYRFFCGKISKIFKLYLYRIKLQILYNFAWKLKRNCVKQFLNYIQIKMSM
jgi:hypothetical protein